MVDGHVHIGRAGDGHAVKISAAPSLTVPAILDEAKRRKGIDIIGIIDAVSPFVTADIEALVDRGDLVPLADGGLLYQGKTTLLLGAEVEVSGPHGGAAHFGVWMPSLAALRVLYEFLSAHQRNPGLSSQRLHTTSATALAEVAISEGGFCVVNHAFTPHKGLYGRCVSHMADMVDPSCIAAVELGLSADTQMADRIRELHAFTYVTNSDAHSLPKLGREYHVASLSAPTFRAYRRALLRTHGEAIVENVGLWPLLGKYHQTTCARCQSKVAPGVACPTCGSRAQTGGVRDRLEAIADVETPHSPKYRPPYRHHVPLQFLPGVGPKLLASLLDAFGTEMRVLRDVPQADLCRVAGERIAALIVAARAGALTIDAGGGGLYGKIVAPGDPV